MAPPEFVSTKACPLVPAFKERPILFSAPMVRALLDGSKTQTRRVMARQKQHAFTDYTLFGQRGHPDDEAKRCGGWAQPWVAIEHAPDWPDGKDDQCICPYARERGNRLWVRESLGYDPEWGHKWADGKYLCEVFGDAYSEDDKMPDRGIPSIHVPRRYSRIDLEVTGVRIERLQDISEADARAEGAPGYEEGVDEPPPSDDYQWSYRASFQRLWERINGAESWAANPWVWVVEFRRIRPL
ncbi:MULTISPECIES: hypothetical protein [Variovorax]|uniref:hypothetical protein n=1 Tax=Variovorax TaxID=34072 RepID=UPI002864EBA1|nr:hypothetical protein [Variovorax sp. 3319]MDR6886087.1 hypothetical protein [Variovorax sp. 3319]